jgi:hypothetical protein
MIGDQAFNIIYRAWTVFALLYCWSSMVFMSREGSGRPEIIVVFNLRWWQIACRLPQLRKRANPFSPVM